MIEKENQSSTNVKLLESKMILKGYKSRKAFANDLGVTQQTINNILNGVHSPRQELMNAIYDKLELTPEEGIAIFFNSNLRKRKVLQK